MTRTRQPFWRRGSPAAAVNVLILPQFHGLGHFPSVFILSVASDVYVAGEPAGRPPLNPPLLLCARGTSPTGPGGGLAVTWLWPLQALAVRGSNSGGATRFPLVLSR